MNLKIDKKDWKRVLLGDVVIKREENDRDNAKNRFTRFLKVVHLNAETLHIKQWGDQENEELPPTFYKIFREGQILFPTRNPHLRRTVLANFDGICGEKTLTLEPIRDLVIPSFIPFLFHSNGFYTHTTSSIIGSTNPHVRWRDVANYEFLLPPKAQQAGLAELLWAADAVVEREKKIYSRLETLFNSWLNSEINAKKSWARKPLSSVAFVQTGVAKNKSISKETGIIKVPYLRVANVQDGFLDLTEVKEIIIKSKDKERYSLQNGDVLLTEGGDFDKLGRGYVWQDEVPNCVHQNHVFAVRTNKEILSPWFLSLVTRSNYGKQYFLRCAKKTSNLASINSSQLKEFRVLIPSMEEQKEIVNQYQKTAKTLNEIQTVFSNSQALQKSLINQIF